MTIKKRGRPVGSKNKIVTLAQMHKYAKEIAKSSNPVNEFAKTLKEWDEMEAETNWEVIAKKQESRIAAYIAENEELAKICVMRWEEISHLKYLITYLERKHEDSSV
jgi:uncharacterized protein YeaO (DUF488 family)